MLLFFDDIALSFHFLNDDPEGWYGEGCGRGVSRLGTHVHPWRIHVDVWQNQYNIVKPPIKINKFIYKERFSSVQSLSRVQVFATP